MIVVLQTVVSNKGYVVVMFSYDGTVIEETCLSRKMMETDFYTTSKVTVTLYSILRTLRDQNTYMYIRIEQFPLAAQNFEWKCNWVGS